MAAVSILWRRLDTPGHDACVLDRVGSGWSLRGTTVFRDRKGPAQLSYALSCDDAWRARGGHVTGAIGATTIDILMARLASGAWACNGEVVASLDDLVDLDFSFTPATNLPQMKRAALAIGQTVDLPVAWLELGSGTLARLPQRYERRTASTFWYEAPSVGYAGLLELTAAGFVAQYPNLWAVEP